MVGVASLVLATTRISALGLGSGSTAGSSQPEARGVNPASRELQAAERRLGAGAGAPELAAKRPPGRRDPLRRHRVTRDQGGGAAAFVAIGYGRAAAAGFRIHTAERKCNIVVVALGTTTSRPPARDPLPPHSCIPESGSPAAAIAFHATRHCAASSLGKRTHCSYRVNATLRPGYPSAPAVDDARECGSIVRRLLLRPGNAKSRQRIVAIRPQLA